ncbi:hypothetical protein [Treponema sp.]|nr:hypothetical protein [Treponema sp.]
MQKEDAENTKKRIEKQFSFDQPDCMTVLISGFEKCTVNWRGG